MNEIIADIPRLFAVAYIMRLKMVHLW